jgi:calcium-dependent protein kinase
MLEAVNYCHLQNICHRDLKPENLTFLNTKSLNLKLIDFGLAFKWNQNMKKELKTKKQNSIVGTPYYIAP